MKAESTRQTVGVFLAFAVLVLAMVTTANARLNMVFTGVEGENQIYWHFSGCLTVDTATTYGPLNDTAWLYPDGSPGWDFFFNNGTGEDLVLKGVNTELVAPQSFRWVIKDSSGTVLETIEVPITGWLVLTFTQSIHPQTAPYTVPNLEVGQQICLEGSGSFTLGTDSLSGLPNQVAEVFEEGFRDRQANGGMLRQTVRIIPDANATDYTAFQSSAFGGETDPLKVGPLADFDLDGLQNLLEFACGSSATFPTPHTEVLKGTRLGDMNCFEFVIRSDAPNLSYQLEYGEVLTWSRSVDVVWDGTYISVGGRNWEVEEGTPLGDGTVRVVLCFTEDVKLFFARLKVTDNS